MSQHLRVLHCAVPVRLIALDIDGTLLDSHWHLPSRNREAIEAALGRGVEVAVVTGRRYDFATAVIGLLPHPVTAIVSNGALVRLPDGSTPIRHLLRADTARRVLDATPAYRAGAGLIFDRPREGQVVFERIDWSHPSRRGYANANRAYILEVEPLEAALTENPIQVMFNGSVDEMRGLTDALHAMPEAEAFAVAVTAYEAHDFVLVDVLTAGCTKGRTLLEWAALRGIPREDVLAIGDNLNDVEMLEAAGQPVVMGNAVPALRARGWPVCASNDDAGVAEAIERFVLDRR
jgi:Cof subfamily protein (haloacid dehalogenase superfamily)